MPIPDTVSLTLVTPGGVKYNDFAVVLDSCEVQTSLAAIDPVPVLSGEFDVEPFEPHPVAVPMKADERKNIFNILTDTEFIFILPLTM
jgi:hypothetical protein